MQKKIEEMDVVELKTVAYDIIIQIENLRNNLQTINTLISKKSQKDI